jgi:urea transporter
MVASLHAVTAYLKSPKYQPPALPFVLDCDWNTILSNDAKNLRAAATPLASKAEKGREILNFALFLMLEEESADHPEDFINVRTSYAGL